MSLSTYPLLSLVDDHATGLKSMLTHYIDATVDSQFASLRNSIETMIQSGVIGPNCDGTHFGMTLPPQTQTNTDQSSDECSHEYSNDTLTIAQKHQNILQNEVSLSNTINTESMIKQEFDDEENEEIHEAGEKIDDKNVAKYEKCEKGICSSVDDAEMGENEDECFSATQINHQAPLANNLTNQLIISNEISPSPTNPTNTEPLIKQECLHDSTITSIPLNFTNITAPNDIFTDEQTEGQNTQIQTDEFDDNYDLDDDGDSYEGDENEYLNNPNSNGVCDLDHDKNNNQLNNEQSIASTSGVRSLTHKRIQTNLFGDLVQSSVNSRKCGKRKCFRAMNSAKNMKRKRVLDDGGEDIDSGDNDNQEEHANIAIGEKIATECTTNTIQLNLAQPNGHLQCPQCHKSFDRNSLLQQHLRVHTGERPFQCDQCDKRFSERSNLTKHQLIHQNIKRFQCDHCDKKFTLKRHLDDHEQAIHLHVKPYRCKQCGHTATQQSNVIKHIRVVHFGLPHTIKEQLERNIIDHRDPREFVEKV